MVPSGKEDTQCVVKRLGNPGPISIHEIHNALGATSHHFIVYQPSPSRHQASGGGTNALEPFSSCALMNPGAMRDIQ